MNYAARVVDAAAPKPTEYEERGLGAERRGMAARFWEWLTLRRALRDARRRVLEATPEARELLTRSRETALIADRLFDAVEPVSLAAGQALAADLYRQSVLWFLAARAPAEQREAVPADLWEAVEVRQQLALPQVPTERDQVIDAVKHGDFRSLASVPPGERQRLAAQLRTLAQSALELGAPADRGIRALLFRRFVRQLAFALLLAAVTTAAVLGADYVGRKPNLAAGKPWKASSTWAVCQPEISTCGQVRSKIFFHTNEDAQPWVEFDLLAPTAFSEVYVRNRTDSVPDRAVPLVIEVSDDETNWRAVARRDDTFRTWTASFPTLTARYVRLRVDRRSYLHLEIVEVHA